MTMRLKYVERFKDRHGHMRYYFRIGKGRRTPMPCDPNTQEFTSLYAQLRSLPVERVPRRLAMRLEERRVYCANDIAQQQMASAVKGSSVVYFVQSTRGGNIKIGFSANLAERISKICTHNPSPIKVLGAIPGTKHDEKAWHTRFADQRTGGEWFHPSAALLAAIKNACSPTKLGNVGETAK